MPNCAYLLSGGAAKILKLSIGASITAGTVCMDVAAAGAGIRPSTTTSAADAVGQALDACTYSATQAASDNIVSVLINPDAVYKWRISGAATDGTQALIVTNSAASAGGTVVTITTGETAGTNYDEATIACISGANTGIIRKVTSVAATTFTVTHPFPNAIAVGDQFLFGPWTPFDVAGNNLQQTTLLKEADQTIAVGTGIEARIMEWKVDFSSVTNARRNSYVYAILDDHILKDAT
jgi:hypothetical protein